VRDEITKQRLKRRALRMLKECEQAIRDCQWWNANRTEHEPMDAEWFIVQAAGLRKVLNAVEHNQPFDPSWLQTE
jgi:hypothetical protein